LIQGAYRRPASRFSYRGMPDRHQARSPSPIPTAMMFVSSVLLIGVDGCNHRDFEQRFAFLSQFEARDERSTNFADVIRATSGPETGGPPTSAGVTWYSSPCRPTLDNTVSRTSINSPWRAQIPLALSHLTPTCLRLLRQQPELADVGQQTKDNGLAAYVPPRPRQRGGLGNQPSG